MEIVRRALSFVFSVVKLNILIWCVVDKDLNTAEGLRGSRCDHTAKLKGFVCGLA